MIHFVSKDTLFRDYAWTIGYYLTLQSNNDLDVIFPSFEAAIIDVNDKADSKVSKVYDRCYALVLAASKKYMVVDEEEEGDITSTLQEFFIGELSPKLGQHGAKKLGVQTLGDLLTISIQDISMRAGWALKAFNTFFDYWVGSLPGNVRCGKMIAGWRTVSDYDYILLSIIH